jgi:hypothetical protein
MKFTNTKTQAKKVGVDAKTVGADIIKLIKDTGALAIDTVKVPVAVGKDVSEANRLWREYRKAYRAEQESREKSEPVKA